MKRTTQALRVAVLIGAVVMVGGYIVYRTMQAPSADPARPAAVGQNAAHPSSAEAQTQPGAAQATHLGGSKSRAVFDTPRLPDATVDDTHFFGSKSAPTFEPPKPPAPGTK